MLWGIFLFFFQLTANAAHPIADVIEVYSTVTNQAGHSLHTGEKISEGDVISTGKAGMVVLEFNKDKSRIRLAENSVLRVVKERSNQPALIELVKGRARLKVDKKKTVAQQKMPESDLSLEDIYNLKMLIKTKTSAVGVSGTEIEIIANEQLSNTTVLAYEGDVQISRIPLTTKTENLSQAMASSGSTKVASGNFVQSNFVADKLIRAPLAPVQYQVLSQQPLSVAPVSSLGSSAQSTEIAHTTVAPGLDPSFVASGVERESSAARILVSGIVDLKSGNVVLAPPGSPVDGNLHVAIVPAELGSVDPKTGGYLAPKNYQMTDGGLKPVGSDGSVIAAGGTGNSGQSGNQPTGQAGGQSGIAATVQSNKQGIGQASGQSSSSNNKTSGGQVSGNQGSGNLVSGSQMSGNSAFDNQVSSGGGMVGYGSVLQVANAPLTIEMATKGPAKTAPGFSSGVSAQLIFESAEKESLRESIAAAQSAASSAGLFCQQCFDLQQSRNGVISASGPLTFTIVSE